MSLPRTGPQLDAGTVVPLWKSMPTVRGLAICLVVANHAVQASSGAFVTAHASFSPGAARWSFLTVLLLRALTPACLVAFFFASGFMACRFFTDAKSSRVAAAQLLRKYLQWSALMLALGALHGDELGWREISKALVLGSAQPAYWFLVVIVALMITTPLWVRLVRAGPRLGLAAAAVLQVASCAFFYAVALRGEARSAWAIGAARPVQFLPGFLAGMWVSREADRVGSWLHARRRLLVWMAAVAAVAAIAESCLLWAGSGFRLEGAQPMFATERATLMAFAFLAVSVLLTTEIRDRRLASWLKNAGSSSLGIMLLMDACIAAVIAAVWHVPALFWEEAALALARGRLPLAIADNALWLTPVLFAAGLWGPLLTMEWARKLAGKRVRYLW